MSDIGELASLRWNDNEGRLEVIDQTLLPHLLQWQPLDTLEAFCHAIAAMQVRGAPLIGVTAAYGLACALGDDPSDTGLERAANALLATRPTAVNLSWALARVCARVRDLVPAHRYDAALAEAHGLCAEDVANCASIGEHGLARLRALPRVGTLNIMTHCNAGSLATVQWGTALAPIYKAHLAGLEVHVWVSETRPRNQGANLTAWELQRAGVPCTVVADNSCGLLLARGDVDCVIVGSDRTAANGDVCNKIGTYLKALAARANDVPFYVALPESTIDWECPAGLAIPIEERSCDEVLTIAGLRDDGALASVRLTAEGVGAFNPAFDVTPAPLVSALITEHGCFEASNAGLDQLRALLAQ
ncbi:MAG: S-methyl-5-thioribose-1-phosphate isomerase [Pseudomonadota bacterium]